MSVAEAPLPIPLAHEVSATARFQRGGRSARWFFAITIFTGAFLLFQVQPLIGKYLLPWFGGGPAVWTTCMLFFQVMLLGGYAYAHLITSRLKPRTQVIVHVVVLVGALSLLPIWPSDRWKPIGQQDPTGQILLLLTVCIGLPYFALSATGPLMQAWFGKVCPGVSPYRLYALSNVGSLLALLSFPFVFEPNLTRKSQAVGWSFGLGLFAVFCVACGRLLWRSRAVPPAAHAGDEQIIEAAVIEATAGLEVGPETHTGQGSIDDVVPVTMPRQMRPTTAEANRRLAPILWLLLSASASALLLAVTNKLCQDVAVVPFLWILPLAIYLLTFIICFDSSRWYVRPVFFPLTAIALSSLVRLWETPANQRIELTWQIIVYSVTLFGCCMLCHGELVRLKPPAERLTAFYLTISAGGALGGVLVSVVAPLLLPDLFELHIALVATITLATLAVAVDPTFGLRALGRSWPWPGGRLAAGVLAALAMGIVILGGTMYQFVALALQHPPASRNFYGVLRAFEEGTGPSGPVVVLRNGAIVHGAQFKRLPFRLEPTTYYAKTSGVGLAVDALNERRPLHIGVVGLGSGTMAAYGRKGDRIRFYEINPAVEHVARTKFWYLGDCQATVNVVLGDARLSLERETGSQQFDLLVLDAFSGDAIPVHLLTREVLQIYNRHLKQDGILAVHVSNQHLDLKPVVHDLAELNHYHDLCVYDRLNPSLLTYTSEWMLLCREGKMFDTPALKKSGLPMKPGRTAASLWTDDSANLFTLLRSSKDELPRQ